MRGDRFRSLGVVVLGAGLAIAGSVGAACGGKKGGLMVAVNTDMKAPKDVNIITLSVLVNNQVKVNYQGRVTPEGKVLLPATVALTEPSDPNASIRVRIVAFQERRARVLRDVRTTIPTDGRVALLRIPLNFVNDGSGTGDLPTGFVVDDVPVSGSGSSSDGGASSSGGSSSGDLGGSFGGGEYNPYEVVQSTCPLDQTIIEGECKDDYVDSSKLPEYDESLVGKGDDPGSCFDVKACFGGAELIGEGDDGQAGEADAGAADPGEGSGGGDIPDAGRPFQQDFTPRALTLDRGTCTLQLNGTNASMLNLAIVTNDTGECIRPNECFIPIDSGEGGWVEESGAVKLPAFVCRLLDKKGLRLAQSTTCAAKKVSNPICAETVPSDGGGGTVDSGGPPSGPAPERLVAEPFPTSLLVDGSNRLTFASANRIGTFDTLAAPPLVPGSIPLQGGGPTGKQPWVLSPFGVGSSVFGFGLTTATSPNGWVSNGGDANLQQVQVGVSPLNGVGQSEGGFVWAVGGDASGGIYTTDGTTGPGVFYEGVSPSDVTFLLGNPSGFLYGTSAGLLRACNVFVGCADGGTSFADGARIDGLAADPSPGQSNFGYALTSAGVVRGQLFTAEGTLTVGARRDAASAGITDGGQYYRRAIASTPEAPGCVFYTTQQGVEWATTDLAGGGVLVGVENALGVWVAHGTSSRSEPPLFVYYTVFADIGDSGGIWRVPVPAQCSGGSTQGPPDAGGGADCLPEGVDCDTSNPGMCCTGYCDPERRVCAPSL